MDGVSACSFAEEHRWKERFGVALLILLATFAAYFPALHGEYLWDDDAHVPKPALRSVDGLCRIWFEWGATQQYYPLLYTAMWAEHRLWGDAAVGYHVTNVLLHASAACLAFLVLRELRVAGAALAAVVFALHPVHVESVAWISEQKNTLSAVFYLSAMLVYLSFDRTRAGRWYALASALFLCGLLSKTVTATLPAALLVLFWWRRGALSWRRDVAPLLPWLILALLGGALTAWFERRHVGAAGEEFALTPPQRLLIAGRAVWFYLAKLLWPTRLVFIYPRWELNATTWWQWLFPASASAATAALLALRKRWRAPLAAWLFFVGTLFPALGFFNVYPFVYSFVADHFQYLASLGIIAAVSAAIASKAPRVVRVALAVASVSALGVLTWRQAHAYADALVLYRTTIERNPGCWMAYNNLGGELVVNGRSAEAVPYLEQALRLKPDYANAHTNLGTARLNLGDPDAALEHFEAALRSGPDDGAFNYNVAVALARCGRVDEAVEYYRRALHADRENVDAWAGLGNALLSARRPAEAVDPYTQALRLAADAQRSLRGTTSDPAIVHSNLGNALAATGRHAQAVEHYRESIRLNPDFADAHYNLANALAGTGMLGQATEEYEQAIRLRADFAVAHHNLAVVLAQLDRFPQAIEHDRRALEIEPGNLDAWVSLAYAYSAMQRPDDAIAAAQKALDLARAGGNADAARQIEAGLNAYRTARPPTSTRAADRR